MTFNVCTHIKTQHSGIFMQDNPNGEMNKDKMMDMYSGVLPGMKAKTFVDQIFQKFDSDNSGSIDFKVSSW